MRNLLKRQPSADPKPTLRERAAALKATAGRVMRRPEPKPCDDSGVALAREVIHYFGNDPLNPALDGDITLREQAHALLMAASIPVPDFGPIHVRRFPPPGSDEARAAFAEACREHSRLTQVTHADYPDLKRSSVEWWTKQSLSRARELGDISVAEYARLYPRASEHEMRTNAILHRLNVGVLHALAYANDPSMLPDTATASAACDLSACTLPQLARLYETWESVFHHLCGASEIPCFTSKGDGGFTPAGEILDQEYDRATAFLGTIADEAARRRPASPDERNERLSVLVRHEMNTNGCPVDSALLAELNAAVKG